MSKKIRLPFWDFLEYMLVRVLAFLVNGLPIAFATQVARKAGDFFYFILPHRRKVAFKNLDIAFGETLSFVQKKSISRESFRNLATSIMEFFRLPLILKEASGNFEIEGTEHLDRALEKGKGVIFVVSHLGSWEYLACLFYLRNYSCTVVVRGVKNPYINRWIRELRAKTRVLAIDRRQASRKILKCLKQNEVAAILIDQWAGSEGIWVDFWGKETSTTSVPARFAWRTGAALIPGYCIRTAAGHYKIVIRPEVAVDNTDPDFEIKTTVELNRQLENEIRQYPEQWTWTHRRWKDRGRYMKRNPGKRVFLNQ